jgi:hypothetical protein
VNPDRGVSSLLTPVFAPAAFGQFERLQKTNGTRYRYKNRFGLFNLAQVQRSYRLKYRVTLRNGKVALGNRNDRGPLSGMYPAHEDFALAIVCPQPNGERLQDAVGGLAFSIEGRASVAGSIGTFGSYPYGNGPFVSPYPRPFVSHGLLGQRDLSGGELLKVDSVMTASQQGSSGSSWLYGYKPGGRSNRQHNVAVGVSVVQEGNDSLAAPFGPQFLAAYKYMSDIDPLSLPECKTPFSGAVYDRADPNIPIFVDYKEFGVAS